MPDPGLYEAILRRTSVRRYDDRPLPAETRQQVQGLIAAIKPLTTEGTFGLIQRDGVSGQGLAAVLGFYGRLLGAPHCLIPHLVGGDWPLVELGFRMEQLAVGLMRLGLGSCFLGVLGDESAAISHWNLPTEARVGAVLIYGQPAQGADRALGNLMRMAIRSDQRLPWEQLFFAEDFKSATPPARLQPVLEAGRWAPSARNAQPWRWLWDGDALTLFVTSHNRRYGRLTDYALFDGGLCMANMSLAMEALGIEGAWQMIGPTDAAPAHPDDLAPLARLTLA